MSGAFPRRWLRAWPWACSCVLLLAGCGGGSERRAQEPRLPRALAQQWADDARTIAKRLDAGDACGARDVALALQRDTIRDIGRVPARFREDLQGGVNDLAERTANECAQATPPPPPPPPPPPAPETTTQETETTTETKPETEPESSTEPTTTEPTEETITAETATEETTTAEDDEGDQG